MSTTPRDLVRRAWAASMVRVPRDFDALLNTIETAAVDAERQRIKEWFDEADITEASELLASYLETRGES